MVIFHNYVSLPEGHRDQAVFVWKYIYIYIYRQKPGEPVQNDKPHPPTNAHNHLRFLESIDSSGNSNSYSM